MYRSLELALPSDGMRNSTVARSGVSSATSRNPSLTNSMTSAGILYFSAMIAHHLVTDRCSPPKVLSAWRILPLPE